MLTHEVDPYDHRICVYGEDETFKKYYSTKDTSVYIYTSTVGPRSFEEVNIGPTSLSFWKD